MKVVVTGANGFLGSWLTRRLCLEKHETFALVRKSSDLSELAGVDCQYLHGDVTDLDSLNQNFQNANAVFHLAGLVAYKASDREKMEMVNVQGTQNVISACLKNRVKRLVHVSSVVAVGAGFTKDEILSENSHYNLRHLNLGYFETKRIAEDLVQQAVRDQQLNAVILNPSTIYGPGDAKKGSRKTQIKVAQGKFRLYPPGGVNVVSAEDVVEGILRAWTGGRTGERYILASENYLIKDVFDIIADKAQVARPDIPLPAFFIRSVGRLGDLAGGFGYETALSSETAWTSTLYHWFDSTKAQRELGLKFQPGRVSIERSVQWMKDNGYLNPGESK